MSPLSEAQQRIRRTGIGSSEIAAIAGLPSRVSAIEVWLRKAGPPQPDGKVTLPMRLGRILEPIVKQLYVEATGAKVTKATTARMKGKAWQDRLVVATPDGLVERDGEKGVLEAKIALFKTEEWGRDNDAVPDSYVAQTVWEMAATGRRTWADVPVLFGAHNFTVYRVPWDEELFNALLNKASSWWLRHVKGKTPPPADGSESFDEYLRRKFKERAGATLQATPELNEIVDELLNVRAEKGMLEDEEKQLKQRVMDAMGEAQVLLATGAKITWKAPTPRPVVDWEGLARTFKVDAALLEAFTTSKEGTRTLRVYRLGE